MPNITSFEILEDEIKKVGGKPTVLEALWDGDTQGWFLCLYLYTETRLFFNKRIKRHSIGHITLGGDIRVFSGGQRTEALLAKEFGEKAVQQYHLEFYFPSDKEPDDDCPQWNERHLAIKCADCSKLIIPTDSPYLPKDICNNCHLKREQTERVKQEKPCDDGVTMYLSKNDEYENIGYCTDFKDFTIAPFINDKVQMQLTEKPISEVILENTDIIELHEQLEKVLNEKLVNYRKPETDSQMDRFVQTRNVEYNGIEYELAQRFNVEHREISRLISSIKTAQKAISENYCYKIYFKKGLSYRDDSILRLINYGCKGSTDIQTINQHYKNTLTESEVLLTLKKLEQIDCLTLDDDEVSITRTGKNIV